MPKSIRIMAVALIAAVAAGAIAFAQDGEKDAAKPKHTIKEVMKGAMKGGLNKKVVGGKATMEEKLALLDMYVSMVENPAPKGEQASWQKFAGAAALAAAKVAVGREGAEKELETATNCAKCHKAHKPPAK